MNHSFYFFLTSVHQKDELIFIERDRPRCDPCTFQAVTKLQVGKDPSTQSAIVPCPFSNNKSSNNKRSANELRHWPRRHLKKGSFLRSRKAIIWPRLCHFCRWRWQKWFGGMKQCGSLYKQVCHCCRRCCWCQQGGDRRRILYYNFHGGKGGGKREEGAPGLVMMIWLTCWMGWTPMLLLLLLLVVIAMEGE